MVEKSSTEQIVAGPQGVIVLTSSITDSTIIGGGITNRGYPNEELAEHSSFEEIFYLLLHSELPTKDQLQSFCRDLHSLRSVPSDLKKMLEIIRKNATPIDVMKVIVSFMGILEKEKEDFSNQQHCAMRLIVMIGPALLYWYHFANSGLRISEFTGENDSIAENFMKLLTLQTKVDAELVRAYEAFLVTMADCNLGPPSTFTSRIVASTKSDYHSAISAAISAVKGVLHGGAFPAIFQYLRSFNSIADADRFLDNKLKNKDVVIGFGHREFKKGDPRFKIFKSWSDKLSLRNPEPNRQLEYAYHLQKRMIDEKNTHPNADLVGCILLDQLHIPTSLYLPVITMARMTGWSAHIFEQRANKKMISPTAKYVGVDLRHYPQKL